MHDFWVYGPTVVPRDHGLITKETSVDFWNNRIEEDDEGLAQACGCYVLATKNRGIRPWYVGKTEKRDFRFECLHSTKRDLFNNNVLNKIKGTPVLFLIPKLTPNGRFAKPSQTGHKDVELLEEMLINVALTRNPNLLNKRGTKILRTMTVPGVFNNPKGRLPDPAHELKEALGLQ